MHKVQKDNQNYLVFGVEGELFALKTQEIREIVEYQKPTPLPLVIPFILGVINLRGQIIPILDLWALFGLGKSQVHEKNFFIILELPSEGKEFWTFGIMVHYLYDVMDFLDNFELPPDFGSQVPAQFLEGIGKFKDRFVLVLESRICFHQENLKSQIMNHIK